MTTFFLCEKPSQARALAKALAVPSVEDGVFEGGGILISHTYGSMLGLAMPDHYLNDSKWRLPDLPVMPEKWDMTVLPKMREQFVKIGGLLARSDRAVIATDPDDAGEVIGRVILYAHGFKGEVKRLWASALDPESLLYAAKHLRPLAETDSFYRAGLAKMQMDWLFGMNLSRLFSIVRKSTSKIGRVKTQLLAELVNREMEIATYRPTMRPEISGVSNGVVFEPTTPGSMTSLDGIAPVANCVSVHSDVVELAPPLPFTLSALLTQLAINGVGLDAGYAAVQGLYEAGMISYPRTGSTVLPSSNATGFANHHAIMPVGYGMTSGMSLSAAQMAAYQAISANYNMNVAGPATLKRTVILMEVGGVTFSHTSMSLSSQDDAGWLMLSADEYERYRYSDERVKGFLPKRAYPLKLSMKRIASTQPDRHSEASLMKFMIERNVGTEATRVAEIGTLVKDGVAIIEEGEFRLTAQGKSLYRDLPKGVLGRDMSDMTRYAVEDARFKGIYYPHLENAKQWLSEIIAETTQGQKSSSLV